MSVIFATEPLWATAFASVLLGEKLGPQAAVGAGFIVAACLTAQGPKVHTQYTNTILLLDCSVLLKA
jgi:drug/metabolite transporter (DMT)-like permease